MAKKEEVKSVVNIETELKPIESEISSFREKAEAMIIADDDQYTLASDTLGAVNTKLKGIEKLRKFFVDPLNAQVKNINGMFKPQVEAADEIVQIIKKKMAVYYDKKETARRAEEARLQKIRDDADAKRLAAGKEKIAEPVREVAMPSKFTATDNAKSQVRKVWTHEILKISELPADITRAILEEAYRKGIVKMVVQRYVDAGTRDMPGVRIFEETRIASGNVRPY